MVVSRLGGAVVRATIRETEAYLGHVDPASHAYRGRRHPGNLGIYSAPGSWYVYRSYGIHWCANVVTGPAGSGSAVLLRAVEVVEGLSVAIARRGQVPLGRLADGPGKLAQALGIDRTIDGRIVNGSGLEIFPRQALEPIARTGRIGISKAVDWPLRFVATTKMGRP